MVDKLEGGKVSDTDKEGDKSSKFKTFTPQAKGSLISEAELQASPAYRKMQGNYDVLQANITKMEKQLEDMTGINQSLQSERRRWMLGDMADDQRAQQLVGQIDTLEKQLGMAKRAIQEYESNVPLLLKRALKAEALEIAETHKVPIGALLECESPAEMERMARALAQSKDQKPENEKEPEDKEEDKEDDKEEKDYTPPDTRSTVPNTGRRITHAELKNMSPEQFAKLDKEGKLKL